MEGKSADQVVLLATKRGSIASGHQRTSYSLTARPLGDSCVRHVSEIAAL